MIKTANKRTCKICKAPLLRRHIKYCSNKCSGIARGEHVIDVGQVFGAWKVLDTVPKKNGTNVRFYSSQCIACGHIADVSIYMLRASKTYKKTRCKQCKNEDRRTGTLARDGRKMCCTCTAVKSTKEFHKSRATKDGFSPNCRRCVKSANMLRTFSIDIDDYEQMLESQHYRCKVCGRHADDVGGRGNCLVVDHCHTSGEIRGLLCSNCNTALGLMNDDPSIAQQAFEYLNKSLAIGK